MPSVPQSLAALDNKIGHLCDHIDAAVIYAEKRAAAMEVKLDLLVEWHQVFQARHGTAESIVIANLTPSSLASHAAVEVVDGAPRQLFENSEGFVDAPLQCGDTSLPGVQVGEAKVPSAAPAISVQLAAVIEGLKRQVERTAPLKHEASRLCSTTTTTPSSLSPFKQPGETGCLDGLPPGGASLSNVGAHEAAPPIEAGETSQSRCLDGLLPGGASLSSIDSASVSSCDDDAGGAKLELFLSEAKDILRTLHESFECDDVRPWSYQSFSAHISLKDQFDQVMRFKFGPFQEISPRESTH